ncbi:hypothetical protein C8R44DRAFT_729265 [Mycena epipterygia]|nr:hypothetical protein C8R44DRAFT_729265 [Mycena epipterygia]
MELAEFVGGDLEGHGRLLFSSSGWLWVKAGGTYRRIKDDQYKEKDAGAEDDKYVGEDFYEIWRQVSGFVILDEATYESHVHQNWEQLRREERALRRSFLENDVQPLESDTKKEVEYIGEEFDAVLKKERPSPNLKRGRKKHSRVNEREGRVEPRGGSQQFEAQSATKKRKQSVHINPELIALIGAVAEAGHPILKLF